MMGRLMLIGAIVVAATPSAVWGCGSWDSGAWSISGKSATQGAACSWCGVRAATPMCERGSGAFSWKVTRTSGTYLQIGISTSSWGGSGTSTSNAGDQFAFVYSHSSGWNRHRGAGSPVSASWGGTWDSGGKGNQFTLTLDCANHQFTMSTESYTDLAVFSYPTSWTTVYAALGCQSSDCAFTIEDIDCSIETTTVTSVTQTSITTTTSSTTNTIPMLVRKELQKLHAALANTSHTNELDIVERELGLLIDEHDQLKDTVQRIAREKNDLYDELQELKKLVLGPLEELKQMFLENATRTSGDFALPARKCDAIRAAGFENAPPNSTDYTPPLPPTITADDSNLNQFACGGTLAFHTRECSVEPCKLQTDIAMLKKKVGLAP